MNKPNMGPEIIEAIHLMHEDMPELETDCYLCLTGLTYSNGTPNREMANSLAQYGYNALEEMGRCPRCGTLYETQKIIERHDELDGMPMSVLYEKYCPSCDIGWK